MELHVLLLFSFCDYSIILIYMKNTLFICHRINNSDDLKTVNDTQGIELDLRDKGDKLILCHDPFCN